MSDLLSKIQNKEAGLEATLVQMEKTKDQILTAYRDQAHQEIARLKAEAEHERKKLYESVLSELNGVKDDIEAKKSVQLKKIDQRFKQHEQETYDVLTKEVLF